MQLGGGGELQNSLFSLLILVCLKISVNKIHPSPHPQGLGRKLLCFDYQPVYIIKYYVIIYNLL